MTARYSIIGLWAAAVAAVAGILVDRKGNPYLEAWEAVLVLAFRAVA